MRALSDDFVCAMPMYARPPERLAWYVYAGADDCDEDPRARENDGRFVLDRATKRFCPMSRAGARAKVRMVGQSGHPRRGDDHIIARRARPRS